jgi:tetratricopeptide (TPR) repeat protein
MNLKASRLLRGLCLIGAFLFLPFLALAQAAGSGQQPGRPTGTDQAADSSARLQVSVQDETGGVITVFALITLSTSEGKVVDQVKADAGHAEFSGLAPGSYTIHVTAGGYESAKQSITVAGSNSVAIVQVRRAEDDYIGQTGFTGFGGTGNDGFALSSSVEEKREMMKIAQALRDRKPDKARMYLFKLYLDNQADPNLNYLYGLYEKEMKDLPQAKFYWKQAVGNDSKNLPALMELAHTALDEGKPAEALPYLKQSAQASPTTWQTHALMVVAYSKMKQYPQAIEEAQRALELGHSQAAIVQPALASTLAAEGNREQAVKVLREYVKEHPDPDAQNLLASLERINNPGNAAPSDPMASAFNFPPLLPSAWMPAAVDDKVPPVEPGVPCSLDTVLHNASMRMTELVKDVDRFEATESLEHVHIGRDGLPSRPEMRTYRYLVSIAEMRPGLLAVDEYRDAQKVQDDPPDGVVTVGLPALALVFHPAQIDNYKFTCEGLARSSSGLAWQVHFQQRADRIPTLHGYRLGDSSFAVGLKGRAWISADNFQIVRLETDLVKPYPEIRLAAEHTVIAYGPVRFRSKDVKLWLPQQAEVYFDWRGKRVHRRLVYTNYSLFSVDTNQKINPPKQAQAVTPDSSAPPAAVKPN